MTRIRILVLACLAVLLTVGESMGAGDMLAGFAAVDITPPLNLEMAGFGPGLNRRATSIHDPLMAHAMVFEVDGKRVAVVGCDVAGVTLDLTRKVRLLVEAGTGIPGEHLLVAATHTHSGPAIPHWADWGERDDAYLSGLPEKIAQAVIAASKKLEPMEVYYGEVPVDGIGENREYKNGPVDKTLRVLEFKHHGKVTGFVVNYSVHNVLYSELMHSYTADLTGVGIARVLKDYPGAVGIFLQGSCGDINPNPSKGINFASPQRCEQMLEKLSDLFARYVRQALQSASPMDVKRLDMETKPLILPEVPTDRALVLRQMLLAEQLLKPSREEASAGAGATGGTELPLVAQRWLR
ncbi:MAG: neutral/alkaline non-lysosomal ceramidase N-terminal domain-containing protein [Acidobacteriia bacterium]|nr:neutral/alkaline non-lysosomal ceramidase N-terminal domain-containing protein [Terriglobia bacterium]